VIVGELAYWQETILRVGGVVVALLLASGLLVYVFLFKMVSFLQSRLGPMEAGPYGSLQLVAEVGRFLQKEDIVPDRADRRVFKMAPYIVMITAMLLFIAIPAGPDAVGVPLDTGIYFVLAVSSISVLGVLMAGWSSGSKYSLIGGLRATGQLIAYELPLVLAVVGVVIQAGGLSFSRIVAAQDGGSIFGWDALGNPFILTQFIALIIFLVAMQAELAQTPFDMPVAESEVVGGYHVEYTGIRFLFFFLAEFASAFAFSAIAAVLFLGGWTLPPFMADIWEGFASDSNWMNFIGPLVLAGKTMVFVFIIFWVRFSYPRLREDQLQAFAWKFLIPLALANIAVTGLLKVVF
jgi:NADH-quinone oxidoreductase subunit H